jgi:4-hydroxy-tetrahydrodipicolinate reductase
MKLAIHGVTGRMGAAVTRLAVEAGDVKIVGGVAAPNDPKQGRDLGEIAGVGNLGVAVGADVASGLIGSEVVIDFSVASALRPLLSAAARAGIAVVSGTTNLDADTKAALDRTAEKVPVLWAPNMSLGVQVLAELVEHAVKRLGPGFDPEIVEIHHRRKIDAPSGTAKRLADAVRAVRSDTLEIRGRDGDVGRRTDEEMAVFGLRGGDVVGDHTVYLLGNGERLELTHRASNRDLFAQGALRGARYLLGKKPGLYTIRDVLG